jgi:hypothetical protein
MATLKEPPVIDYAAEGLTYSFEVPLAAVVATGHPAHRAQLNWREPSEAGSNRRASKLPTLVTPGQLAVHQRARVIPDGNTMYKSA